MGMYKSRIEECVTCTLLWVALALIAALLLYEAYLKGAFSGHRKDVRVSAEVWNTYNYPDNK